MVKKERKYVYFPKEKAKCFSNKALTPTLKLTFGCQKKFVEQKKK